MDVEVHEELLLLEVCYLLTQLLREIDRRMQHLTRVLILPIQVTSRQRAPIVPVDHTVHIEHRYDVELKMLLQVLDQNLLFLRFGVEKRVENALDHPGSSGLAWVDARRNHYHLLFDVGLWLVV